MTKPEILNFLDITPTELQKLIEAEIVVKQVKLKYDLTIEKIIYSISINKKNERFNQRLRQQAVR